MRRRLSSADDDVSLFPFLSIIACIIGVLTMMIATLALAQTDTTDVVLIEQYEGTERELRQTEQAIESLRRELAVSNSTTLELREQKHLLDITLAELSALLLELERVEQELAEQQHAAIVVPPIDENLRETVADLESQYEQLNKALAVLEAELAQRTEANESQVTILPQGSGINFVPHFVECADGSVVLHSQAPPKRIRAGEVTTDETFLRLLETAANGKDDTIIFLVRADGLSTYHACKRLCDEREIRNGKLPVVGKGRIDLTAFANRTQEAVDETTNDR